MKPPTPFPAPPAKPTAPSPLPPLNVWPAILRVPRPATVELAPLPDDVSVRGLVGRVRQREPDLLPERAFEDTNQGRRRTGWGAARKAGA